MDIGLGSLAQNNQSFRSSSNAETPAERVAQTAVTQEQQATGQTENRQTLEGIRPVVATRFEETAARPQPEEDAVSETRFQQAAQAFQAIEQFTEGNLAADSGLNIQI